jgi:hypothetical protein
MKKIQKFLQNSPQFTTICLKYERVLLGFSTFIFWVLPNLAEYTYEGLPLEQHQKFEKKKNMTSYLIDILIYIYIWQVWMEDQFFKDIYRHL